MNNIMPTCFLRSIIFWLTLLGNLLLSTTGFTIFILLHLLLGPFWLLAVIARRGVIAASKWFVVGIGRPLHWRDVLLLENFTERHGLSIVSLKTLDGDMSSSRLQQIFSENVLEAKIGIGEGGVDSSSHSRLRFPELTQVLSRFCGYGFWVDDPHFQIGNHIQEIHLDEPGCPAYFKSYEGMLEEFSGRAYKAGRSPWELWLVRKFPVDDGGDGDGQPKRMVTVLIWRSHHSLMDAYSILNLLVNFLGKRSQVKQIPTAGAAALQVYQVNNQLSIFNMVSLLMGLVSGFYQLQLVTIQNLLAKRAIVNQRGRRGGGGVCTLNKVNFRLSSRLPLRRVKELAAHLGLRVPSLLVALISESLAGVLVLPAPGVKSLNSFYVLPLPNHPGTAVNHAHLGMLRLPMSSTGGGGILSKAQSINESFLHLRSSPLTHAFNHVLYILAHLPTGVASFFASRMSYVPLSISNFAVGDFETSIGGVDCVDFKGGFGPTRTSTDCVITILGYKSYIEIILAAIDSFLSAEELERIASGIGDNFDKLVVQSRIGPLGASGED